VSEIHIADTGLLVAAGQPSNSRYQALRGYARRNDLVFVVPERVYDELTTEDGDADPPAVDTAIDEGWVKVADSLDYTESLVSKAMDGIQRYIANADDRQADEIERADAALAGHAAQALATGSATHAYIYTTDIAAGEGAETVLADERYGDAVTFVNGFALLEDLVG
jgi:hypothetical protein